jgi:S-adenosylmethionine/arginine decarboxylase-like enzyme
MIHESYGKELILDLNNCNIKTFTRESIGNYFDQLCELIDMKAEDRYFWDDEGVPSEECQTDPKTCGVSAVQFILTSTIVVHSLTKLRKVFINIFSCKDFDVNEARGFTIKWFNSKVYNDVTVMRI